MFTEPVDFVYTWVNGEDPVRSSYMRYYRNRFKPVTNGCDNYYRFEDHGELKYSLRSLDKYVNWIRNIYVVTSFDQVPEWLDVTNPRIKIVSDYDIMPEGSTPTFNSHAIEANLHKIDGLSELFVYSCDDFYANSVLTQDDFFSNGLPISFFRTGAIAPKGTPEPIDGYRCGIKNANNILDNLFGVKDREYIKHVFYPLCKSVYLDLHSTLSHHLCHTSYSKFRGLMDVCMHSMLVPHFLYESGRSITRDFEVASFRDLKDGKSDHLMGHINKGQPEEIVAAFRSMFPQKSQFEYA